MKLIIQSPWDHQAYPPMLGNFELQIDFLLLRSLAIPLSTIYIKLFLATEDSGYDMVHYLVLFWYCSDIPRKMKLLVAPCRGKPWVNANDWEILRWGGRLTGRLFWPYIRRLLYKHMGKSREYEQNSHCGQRWYEVLFKNWRIKNTTTSFLRN